MALKLLFRLAFSFLLSFIVIAILVISIGGMLLPTVVLICDTLEKIFGVDVCGKTIFVWHIYF